MMAPSEDETLFGGLYSLMASAYATHVVPRFEPIARRTVELAVLRPGDRVLDVGCGTGLATFLAARLVGPSGDVTGVDYSAGQLEVARRAAPEGTRIRFVHADATLLPYEGSFDAAASNLGLPPHFDAALRGMRRALRPGGRVSVCEWATAPRAVFDEGLAALASHRREDPSAALASLRAVAAARRAAFEPLGDPRGFRQALEVAGFVDAEARVEPHPATFNRAEDAFDFLSSWGVMSRELAALDASRRDAFRRDVLERLGRFPQRVTWEVVHAHGRAPGPVRS